MTPTFALLVGSTLVHLSPVDLVIIVFYFALVLAIGLYLKERANTGEVFLWRSSAIAFNVSQNVCFRAGSDTNPVSS
jgi:hypothetical protein